ncbi:DUF2752 domain-containing protein [Streptomyces sp. TRM68367]|uniref:DUF2752 domain-containing protein n=1 Tax=Streptomyces sp. TRM68367 TaxID=2758415 RepID=UPI00165BF378|nr:DUF2752 domain-containing protein [Streptomyces sp. TRM68367]MBC9725018.1 DUF2752 domain-containing protein [Streptomyces sp. TRM68367]
MSGYGRRWTPCRPVWEERDRHRWLGPLALVGIAAGGALAVFGLPPVDLHGPLHYAGVMGPLCGGTRGLHAAMLGDFDLAWRYNPLSVVLVAGAAAVLLREAAGRISGRWLNLHVARRWPVVMAGLALLVALTARQQAHADLLRTGPETGTPTGLLLYAAAVPLVAVALVAVMAVRRSSRERAGHG